MTSSVDLEKELFLEFLAEANDALAGQEERFILLEQEPNNLDNINAIFRSIHSVKGNAAFFQLTAIRSLSHKMETLLDELRNQKRRVTEKVISTLLEGMDLLKANLASQAGGQNNAPLTAKEETYLQKLEEFLRNVTPQALTEGILKALPAIVLKIKDDPTLQSHEGIHELLEVYSEYEKQLTEIAPASTTSLSSPNITVTPSQAADTTQTNKPVQSKKTMRIDEQTVDGFMYYIGELISSTEVFNFLQKKLENEKINPDTFREIKNAILAFNSLSKALQKNLMEIRKVPLKNLFAKAPRLVRDFSQNLGKEIQTVLVGENTTIDKSLLESLEDPFIHMIRNSMDHGLEKPEVRLEAGKNPKGTLKIEGSSDKNFLYLKISDDGAGIHPEKIKAHAIKKGIIKPEQAEKLTDKEAIQMIFLPGFSTAEKVSEVSGRGVGMDVVLSNIKRFKGTIDVASEVGQGTTITISLPLSVTLIVISGLVVKVGKENFIVPLDHVLEVAEPSSNMFSNITGNLEVIRYRDHVYPVVRLNKIFETSKATTTTDRHESMVIVEKDGTTLCLIVDQVIGLQQVVIKDIGEVFKKVHLILGGVILGDGRVGLVLDIKEIVENHEVTVPLEVQEELKAATQKSQIPPPVS